MRQIAVLGELFKSPPLLLHRHRLKTVKNVKSQESVKQVVGGRLIESPSTTSEHKAFPAPSCFQAYARKASQLPQHPPRSD